MGGWYLLVLFVLLVGMTCGWALPSCVEEGERQIITQQASALLAQAASPQMPLAAMLLTAMLNALRTVGLLFVGSLSPYLAVFSGIALWAKGFGIGFTPVSYTHLDVYKRQVHADYPCMRAFAQCQAICGAG